MNRLSDLSLAVLGCGNMARAMLLPLEQVKVKPRIYTYTPSFTSASALAQRIGGVAYREINELPEADVYLLAMKPQQLPELAQKLEKKLPADALVVSVLAGVPVSHIQKVLHVHKVIRCMPNTPVLVGQGVTAMYSSMEVSSAETKLIEELFSTSTKIFSFLDEEKIDQITPVSASGPAYFFEWARLLEDHLQKSGFTAHTARAVVAQTMLGSAQMLAHSSESAQTLKERVTSKKGVTFEALQVFERHQLAAIVDEALRAADQRILELAKEVAQKF